MLDYKLMIIILIIMVVLSISKEIYTFFKIMRDNIVEKIEQSVKDEKNRP